MTFLASWYGGYRRWEDGYIAMLDALNEGKPVDPAWSNSDHRRKALRNCVGMSTIERRQLRDFIWRYRGWRGWAWLAAICCACSLIGWLFHVAWPNKFGVLEGVVIVNLMVAFFGLAVVGTWFHPRKLARVRPRNVLIVAGLTIAGGLAGASVTALLDGENPWLMLQRAGSKIAVGILILGVAFGTAYAFIVWLRNRELAALNAQLLAAADRERLGKEVSESRLRLLQAQIEPHFLFNTLGAVVQISEQRAPEAAALTGHLIRFLRNSMSNFRVAAVSLDSEIALIQSYLQIMQFRLGPRLAYRIDTPDHLRDFQIRPTLLITFVENAIKHGIEPSLRGGEISVSARASGQDVVLEVADTGVGMADVPGSGHGLENVKQQLALAYGGKARLELLENDPSGLIVRLTLPIEGTR